MRGTHVTAGAADAGAGSTHPPVGDVSKVAHEVGAQRKHLVRHAAAARPHLAQVRRLLAAGRQQGSPGEQPARGARVSMPRSSQQGAHAWRKRGGAPRKARKSQPRAADRPCALVLPCPWFPALNPNAPQQAAVVQARLVRPALRLVHPLKVVQFGRMNAPLKVRPGDRERAGGGGGGGGGGQAKLGAGKGMCDDGLA